MNAIKYKLAQLTVIETQPEVKMQSNWPMNVFMIGLVAYIGLAAHLMSQMPSQAEITKIIMMK